MKRLRAVEPSQLAVRLAVRGSPLHLLLLRWWGLDGQRLPLADDTADSLLCTWSLCTIPDPVAAVAEMRRVLRPGGVQQRVVGGCHLSRDIPAIIESAAMTITRLDTYYGKGQPKPYAAMYEGVAVGN